MKMETLKTNKETTEDNNDRTNILVQTFGKQKRWINYRLQAVDNRITKVPYAVTGLKASSTDTSTWSTHNEAIRVSDKVGIIFTPDMKLLGIDIDHCLKENSIVHEQREAIADFIFNAHTYTEISPSKEGLHLFLIITEPLPLLAHKKAPFECYTSGRYFTVTGMSYGKPRPVRTVTKEEALQLLSIIDYPWGKTAQKHEIMASPINDSMLLNKMFTSKNGAKIKALYDGDITGHNEDDSSADMALCSHLAFWTARNTNQIERMWLASPLGAREKTQGRKDYRDRTIDVAIKNCKEVYTSLGKGENPIEREFQKLEVENVTKQRAVITCLADIKSEPIRWLWPERIALGKLTLIVGDPNLGKSLLTSAMAAIVSKGNLWPIDKTQSPVGDVLLLSAEDDAADTIKPRLDAAEADCNRIHILQAIRCVDNQGKPTQHMFSFKRDLAVLEETLPTLSDCRLLVIDPISAYLDGADSHNNADVRGLLAPLAALAAQHKIAIVAVSHLNKSSNEGNALYRAMGSLAFIAAARAGYIITRDKENKDRRLFMPIKNNIAKENTGLAYSVVTAENGAPIIVWESEPVTMTASEALALPEQNGERNATDEAVDFLQDFLSNGAVKTSQVQKEARGAGISDKSLRRAREKLGIKPKKSRFAGGWEWGLTEDAQSSQDALSKNEGILGEAGHLGNGDVRKSKFSGSMWSDSDIVL